MTDKRHAHVGLPEFHLHGVSQVQSRSRVVRRARRFTLATAAALLLGLGATLLLRHVQASALAARTRAQAVLPVQVVQPVLGSHGNSLTLPGTLQGGVEARIYARASGYVRHWNKDIGQRVKKGELLATLEIPEVDAQVKEAQANADIAKTSYERWTQLRAHGAVSQQDYDEKAAAYHSTAAELQRLREQQSFGEVRAPFSGIITRRDIDNGSLVNAGNGGSAQELFALAQVDRLHVYVEVPQASSARVHVGDRVQILRPESPDRLFQGRIVRTAGAIDPVSRTLQVEIVVPNADHALLVGSYVDVKLALACGADMTLPTTALLFGAAGSRVALVGADGQVRLQRVTLGTDFGNEVEISGGLQPGDRVIANPPDSIADGQVVQVEATKTQGS